MSLLSTSVNGKLRMAHAAIVHSLSTSQHNYKPTIPYMHQITVALPMLKCCTITWTL